MPADGLGTVASESKMNDKDRNAYHVDEAHLWSRMRTDDKSGLHCCHLSAGASREKKNGILHNKHPTGAVQSRCRWRESWQVEKHKTVRSNHPVGIHWWRLGCRGHRSNYKVPLPVAVLTGSVRIAWEAATGGHLMQEEREDGGREPVIERQIMHICPKLLGFTEGGRAVADDL